MALNGPKLERKQLQLRRVVQIASDLFVMSSTISKANHIYKKDPSSNCLDLADLFCNEARKRVDENFSLIACNHDSLGRKVSKTVLDKQALWQEQTF